jgi:hypothetical protein
LARVEITPPTVLMLAGIACAASGAGGMLVSGLNASGIVFVSIGILIYAASVLISIRRKRGIR